MKRFFSHHTIFFIRESNSLETKYMLSASVRDILKMQFCSNLKVIIVQESCVFALKLIQYMIPITECIFFLSF